jgi:hypothetical protein
VTEDATTDDELARAFAFEADFTATLRCIPMAVRYKLDAAGVKLSLKEWAKLGEDERRALLAARCHADADAAAFGARAIALVEARTGAPPRPLPPVALSALRAAGSPPPEVLERAAREGVALSHERWAALTPLRRFALTKLARPSHEGASFAAALREFGLA